MSDSPLKETPSQTAGPYVHIGTLPAVAGLDVRQSETVWKTGLQGEPIIVEGVIRDGAGELVLDAMVEIWQADADGNFDSNGQSGFARAMTDFKTGVFRFETVKPGSVADGEGQPQAPHITFYIFARGINIHLHTRVYFSDEAAANDGDPVLGMIDDEAARQSLVAQLDRKNSEKLYRFDVSLQGEGETVFFDI